METVKHVQTEIYNMLSYRIHYLLYSHVPDQRFYHCADREQRCGICLWIVLHPERHDHMGGNPRAE